jgi:hypothetical protein
MTHPEKSRKRMRQKIKSRAAERFGLVLSDYDVEQMIEQIRNQTSIFVTRSSRRMSLHIVKSHEKLLPVVYDKQRAGIVTVLPEHVLKNWLMKKHVRKILAQGV